MRVRDLEESVKFYTEIIGLEVFSQFSTGNGLKIAFLGRGETKVELISDDQERISTYDEDISWGFEVESLDTTLSFIRDQGIEICAGPFQPTPFTRYFFIEDPNGFTIQIVENIKK